MTPVARPWYNLATALDLMLTLVRLVAVLIACHLGNPGWAAAELSPSSVPAEPPPAPTELEPGPWRPDSVIGLAGDLDPSAVPVKLPEFVDNFVHGPDPVRIVQAPVAQEPPTAVASAELVRSAPAQPEYKVERDNHHVRQFIDLFQTGYRRAVVEGWLSQSGRYLPMILDVFRQKGLPDELVFTAMIESGFNPRAVSRAGAKGIWQFMAPTAKRYGLRIDEWMDERLDPEKSTIAAARHLLDLYAVFGSWNLVQAAYNAGEMRLLQAIRAMGTSDFWTLRSGPVLPDETKNFIPAIQAATVIAQEPERYGFVVTPAEPLSYEIVMVPRSTKLTRLAGQAGIATDSLERLNPELRLKETPPDGPYPLKVPVSDAKLVRAVLERGSSVRHVGLAPADQAPRRTVSTVHVVKPRDTAASIARRYGISVADLLRWNDIQGTPRIRPGDRLRLTGVSRDEGQGGFK